jgi:hypothetical protein
MWVVSDSLQVFAALFHPFPFVATAVFFGILLSQLFILAYFISTTELIIRQATLSGKKTKRAHFLVGPLRHDL